MPDIILKNVTKIYPFEKTGGLFGRREKEKKLAEQKKMPHLSNEGVIALQHISHRIRSGEFVVILGPSGGGKSTLLRLIAGLEKPTLGEIFFDDRNMANVKAEDRNVSMVFQEYALYPNQSVYENIAFPLLARHETREEIEQKVREAARWVSMDSKLDVLIHHLSGGEMQRVALARALVKKPEVLLLDEPFSNLDVLLRNRLLNLLRDLHEKSGCTFVYVTHEQSDAMLLADSLLLIKDGILQQAGSVIDLYQNPRDLFTMSFVGYPAANIWRDVPVWHKGNKHGILLGENEIVCSNKAVAALRKRDTVTVAIRPVRIQKAADGIHAVFDYMENIGADSYLHARMGDREILSVQKTSDLGLLQIYRGADVYFRLDTEDLYYFDEKDMRIA